MNIDKHGYTLANLEEILNSYEEQLRQKYGSDFYIKPEGVIDNIITSVGLMEMSLQEQIAFLAKQFDPETAEDYWQDALYARIEVKRLKSNPTDIKKKIKGTAGYSGSANSITIRSSLSNEEFENKSSYVVGEDGTAEVEFECVLSGPVTVTEGESLTIVSAPPEIRGISDEGAKGIVIGRERESDNEFRIRFRNSKAQNAKATCNANIANLLPYVDNPEYLRIYDKKIDNTMEAGTIKIIAKHNTTDEEFAEAIFNTVALGPDLLGDKAVMVKNRSGQEVEVRWKQAEDVSIDIKGEIKIKNGYYGNTVMTRVKEKIMEYIEKRLYGLESKIYATEFIVPMLEADGIEAVTKVEVKRGTDNTYTESVELTREEVPVFSKDRITLIQNN